MKIVNSCFICLCIIFFVTSCSTVSVEHDYDITINFANLKSYDWLPYEKSFGGDIQSALRENSLTEERIKTALNWELKSKGLRIESKNPDFYIAFYTGIEKEVKSYPHFSSHSDFSSHTDFGIYQYDEETFIIDFLDAKSKSLIWRGIAKAETYDNMNPEQRRKLVNEAVRKIMKNYPPKSIKGY